MDKKTKYIILTPPKEENTWGGVVVVETMGGKTTCYVSLFGITDYAPILLLDDMVKVRQFEIAKNFSEIDLDPAVGFATDIVV